MNQLRVKGAAAGALGAGLVIAGLTVAPQTALGVGGGGGTVGNEHKTLSLVTPVTRSTARRVSSKQPEWINQKDCLDNMSITFRVTGNVPTGKVLHAYMSGTRTAAPVDCRLHSNRVMTSVCFEFPGNMADGFKIDANTILGNMQIAGCSDQTNAGNVSAEFFFLYVDEGNPVNVTDYYATFNDLHVDIWGPSPPKLKDLLIGDGQITVPLDTTSSSDAVSYNIYRDPPPSTAPASCGDAGVSDASASDAGGVTAGSNDCGSTLLIPGQIPACLPIAATLKTGSKAVTGLTNGTSYVFAAAATDGVDNPGPLSELSCGIPQPVDSFFKDYCEDGGHACQPGGCGVSGIGAEEAVLWPVLSSVAVSALGLTLIRRRRRAARRSPEAK